MQAPLLLQLGAGYLPSRDFVVKFIVLYLNTNLSGFSPSLFKKAKKLSSFFFPNNGKFQLVLHLNTVQAFPGKWSESVTLLSFAFLYVLFLLLF